MVRSRKSALTFEQRFTSTMQRLSFVFSTVIAGAILVGGCAPAGTMTLVQPQLQGWQRELRLATERIHWAGAGDEKVERVLAEFPLPGARTGTPTYLLYLRLPAGESNVSFAEPVPQAALAQAVDTAQATSTSGDPADARGRGFFIQTRGEYAGLARLTGGTVKVRGKSRAEGATRTLELDLVCEDGSRIVGQLQAIRDEYTVSRFESKRRPADVRALDKPLVAPAGNPRR